MYSVKYLYGLLLLGTCGAMAQSRQAPIVSSASNWSVLVITPTDTVAKGSEVVTKSKGKPKLAPTETEPVTAPAAKPATDGATAASAPSKTPEREAPARPVVTARGPAGKSFLETFSDNRNGWLTGRRNGFELEVAGDNSYYMRSTRTGETGRSLPKPGRSYIKLPESLNLNRADTFTVSVEMVTPQGIMPDAGLLIGVKDTSNYCQFRLLDKSKVALYTRVNGAALPNYMMGKPTPARVRVDAKRNTLTIRRTGDYLHFYINGEEVEDSPHPYRPFKGNGVGFISYATAVKFQYLTVQVVR